jgi:hypothetical protein
LGNKLFALYQGMTSVVPQKHQKEWGFSPCSFFPLEFRSDFTVAGAKALTTF